MARTPALSNYRTTKVPKPKVPGATNDVNNMSTINVSNVDDASGGNSNPLSAYANNTPSTNANNNNPITSSATHEGTVNMGNNMSADITNAAKEPVNSNMDYYQQLANLTSRNDLLVEKYGLQSYRDEAVSQMAQQDVMRQQSEKALQEQMRATGLNSGALSETMQGNLLMNYNNNIKDINSDYTNKVSNEVKTIQDQNYQTLLDDLSYTLSSDEAGQMDFTSARELYNKIMDADISAAQKQQIIKNYGLDPTQYLAKGVTANDDGTFNYEGLTLPAEFEGLVGNEEAVKGIYDAILKTYSANTDELKELGLVGLTDNPDYKIPGGAEIPGFTTGEPQILFKGKTAQEKFEKRVNKLIDKYDLNTTVEEIEELGKNMSEYDISRLISFMADITPTVGNIDAKTAYSLYKQFEDQKTQAGEEAANEFEANVKGKVDNAKQVLKTGANNIKSNIKNATENLSNKLKEAYGNVKDKVNAEKEKIKEGAEVIKYQKAQQAAKDKYNADTKELENKLNNYAYKNTVWGQNEDTIKNALSGKIEYRRTTPGNPNQNGTYVSIMGDNYNLKEISQSSLPTDLSSIKGTNYAYSGSTLYIKDKTAVAGWKQVQGITTDDLFNKLNLSNYKK